LLLYSLEKVEGFVRSSEARTLLQRPIRSKTIGSQRGNNPRYFISPSLRACSPHRNKFRYGLRREFQSLHRLSQSARRKSHRQSLITLMGRVLFARVRTSKMNSARQLCSTSSVTSVLVVRDRSSFFIVCTGKCRKDRSQGTLRHHPKRLHRTVGKRISPQMATGEALVFPTACAHQSFATSPRRDQRRARRGHVCPFCRWRVQRNSAHIYGPPPRHGMSPRSRFIRTSHGTPAKTSRFHPHCARTEHEKEDFRATILIRTLPPLFESFFHERALRSYQRRRFPFPPRALLHCKSARFRLSVLFAEFDSFVQFGGFVPPSLWEKTSPLTIRTGPARHAFYPRFQLPCDP